MLLFGIKIILFDKEVYFKYYIKIKVLISYNVRSKTFWVGIPLLFYDGGGRKRI